MNFEVSVRRNQRLKLLHPNLGRFIEATVRELLNDISKCNTFPMPLDV